jgi:hypothetical protein
MLRNELLRNELMSLVAPTRRRKAKEDEADGVSLLSFAFHPPSPRHQTKEALLIKSRSMTSLHNGIDQGFLR